MKVHSLLALAGCAMLAIAGANLRTSSLSSITRTVHLGQEPAIVVTAPKRTCLDTAPSYCNNSSICETSTANPRVWHCFKCSGATANFRACLDTETGSCTPGSTNKCGDALEDFKVKTVGGTCDTDCVPATVVGLCSTRWKHSC